MYSFDSRIRYSEVDKSATLTIESLINYFQDCSTFQTEDGPASMEYLMEKGMAWVLNFWDIEIKRLPKLCEHVTIGTIPYDLKGFFGLRNFFMDTRDGKRLAVANSVWTLFDFVKGVPTKVTQEIIDASPLDSKMDMEYSSRNIALPKDVPAVPGKEIVIREHHLDTNNHVNNGQYIRMAMRCLPEEHGIISRIRAEYKKQTMLGDVLYPDVLKVSKNDNLSYTINLKNADSQSVCVVEFVAQ